MRSIDYSYNTTDIDLLHSELLGNKNVSAHFPNSYRRTHRGSILLGGGRNSNLDFSEWIVEILMIKPDFQAMTPKELLAYMREHRDDDEAFHVFMDKVHAEPSTEIYPAPQSIDDLKHFPQLLEKFRAQKGH